MELLFELFPEAPGYGLLPLGNAGQVDRVLPSADLAPLSSLRCLAGLNCFKNWNAWELLWWHRVHLGFITPASHVGVPAWSPSCWLLIQLPANVPGKAAEVGSSTWIPVSTCKTHTDFLAPGFNLVQCSCDHWGSKLENERPLFLPSPAHHSPFQINKANLF